MVKVCIIGKQQPRYIRDKMKNAIENSGFSADILDMPTREVKDYAERLSAYDAIISAGESIDAAALSELKNLKLISRFGIGTNEIDKEEATKRGNRAADIFAFQTRELDNDQRHGARIR